MRSWRSAWRNTGPSGSRVEEILEVEERRVSPVTLRHLASGKVRDIYELDDKHLLFVTSDRMSAFDVVMAELIPDKGRVLTALTAFWVEQLAGVAPSHLVGLDVPAGAA